MSLLLALFACLALSALAAGSETGYYSIHPLRLRHEARRSWRAALLARVVRPPAAFLITLLLANNFANDAAVQLAGEGLARLGYPSSHLEAALILTPLIFLLGEALPKHFLLARPLERTVALAPLLAVLRVLLAPLAVPFGGLLRRVGLGERPALGRHLVAGLFRVGKGATDTEERVVAAAHRALAVWGKGLGAFLQPLECLPADTGLNEVRQRFAESGAPALLLADPEGGPPRLLEAETVALAGEKRRPWELAREIPQLPLDWELSQALARLRAEASSFALVGEGPDWAGVLELESLLDRLLTPSPTSASPP